MSSSQRAKEKFLTGVSANTILNKFPANATDDPISVRVAKEARFCSIGTGEATSQVSVALDEDGVSAATGSSNCGNEAGISPANDNDICLCYDRQRTGRDADSAQGFCLRHLPSPHFNM
jgi:hypothetical protein